VERYLLFGGVLALALLTYDLFSLIFYLIGYHLLFKKPLPKVVLSIVLALLVYSAFGILAGRMDGIVQDVANSKYLAVSLRNSMAAITSNPISWGSYTLFSGFLPNYMKNVSNAVFVFPLFLGALGLSFLISRPKLFCLVGLLALPSLM